jgi:hypothetical protein
MERRLGRWELHGLLVGSVKITEDKKRTRGVIPKKVVMQFIVALYTEEEDGSS